MTTPKGLSVKSLFPFVACDQVLAESDRAPFLSRRLEKISAAVEKGWRAELLALLNHQNFDCPIPLASADCRFQ